MAGQSLAGRRDGADHRKNMVIAVTNTPSSILDRMKGGFVPIGWRRHPFPTVKIPRNSVASHFWTGGCVAE